MIDLLSYYELEIFNENECMELLALSKYGSNKALQRYQASIIKSVR